MFMPGVWILWSKKKIFVIIFQKENGNTFTLFIIFIVKSLQKEQNSTNLLLWPPICRNKSAITQKWFNSLDTNSIQYAIGNSTNLSSLVKVSYFWIRDFHLNLAIVRCGETPISCIGMHSMLRTACSRAIFSQHAVNGI